MSSLFVDKEQDSTDINSASESETDVHAYDPDDNEIFVGNSSLNKEIP